MIRLISVAAIALFAFTFPASRTIAQPQEQESPSAILIVNARIFDVEAGTLSDKDQSILIVGNKIEAINNATEYNDATVIDVEGRVVLPGLIDLHSHLLLHPYDEATWNDQVLKESLELRTIRATRAARRTLKAGFTTLRDLGTEGAGFADIALRDAVKQDIIIGPRIFAVTKALVTTGGYGPMGFDPRWDMPVGAQTADGVAECRKVTREQIAAGADWIKVYADYRRRSGDPSTPTFSQDELNAIVDEANSAGIPVAAHAATDEGIRRSVNARVKTIEHGYEASLETLKLMKENGVVLCPTLTASESIARYGGWNPKTDPDHPRIATARTLMKNALDSGVTIACGSDVGVFSHGDNARELELMYGYGMPIEDVIRSATVTAAKVLQQDELGAIKPNMLADLIVVNEDPTKELSTLRNPLIVIKNGILEFDQLYEGPNSFDSTLDSTPELSLDSMNAPAASRSPRSQGSQGSQGSPNASATEGQEFEIRSGNANEIAEQLKQLDMSKSIQVLEINPSEDETADKPSIEVVFRLEKDGSYSMDGKPIAKGDLARTLSTKSSEGNVQAKIQVVGELDYDKLLKTQTWLKELEVRNVSFEVVKE